MEFIPIIFNIAILSVILWLTWKSASGSFVEKKDLHAMIVEYMLANDVYDVVGLMHKVKRLQDQIIALPNDFATMEEIAAYMDDVIAPEERKPESPTLQAVESGARIASEAFTLGSKAVLDALTRDGRIAGEVIDKVTDEAINIGEEDYEIHPENPVLADIIIARNQQAAEQMGDKINDDLMRFMDEVQK